MKKRIIAVVSVVVSWALLDFVFHGTILMSDYSATAQLWRPMAEMSPLFMNIIALLAALIFVFVYCRLISGKSVKHGMLFGLGIGLLTGIYFGIGSYGWMPITVKIAGVWAIADIVKFTVAGAIAGYFVKE
jgi:hypothetical protein